jgi:hypothetical protein
MIYKSAYLQFGNKRFNGIREVYINVEKSLSLPNHRGPNKWKIEMAWRGLGDFLAIRKLVHKGNKIFDFFFEAEEADPKHKGHTVKVTLSGKITIERFELTENVFNLGQEAVIIASSENLVWNGEDPDAPVKVVFS